MGPGGDGQDVGGDAQDAEDARGEDRATPDERFAALAADRLRALAEVAVLARRCACPGAAGWFAYRRDSLVADERGVKAVSALVGGVEVERSERLPGMVRARLAEGGPDPLVLSALVAQSDPGALVAPDHLLVPLYHMLTFPYSLPTPVGALGEIAVTKTAGGPSVGVLDTGCIVRHPWWQGQVDAADEAPPSGAADIASGHGTFITGVVRQVAPGVRVVARRASAELFASEWDAAAALLELGADERVGVLNVSLGTYVADGSSALALRAAVEELRRQRGDSLVIVAAAGNQATDAPVYPACLPGVVAVGAVVRGRRGTVRAPYSNHGPWVDACAAGSWDSAYFDGPIAPLGATFNGYAHWVGTSFAAPVVAARIAGEAAAGSLSARQAAGAVLGAGAAVPGVGRYVA
ncbi:MAG: S8/S53 family peptidase [Actinobacteria bacterium]|nr:S8/S53 family peptidase [Actinomycetota bacterium]